MHAGVVHLLVEILGLLARRAPRDVGPAAAGLVRRRRGNTRSIPSIRIKTQVRPTGNKLIVVTFAICTFDWNLSDSL